MRLQYGSLINCLADNAPVKNAPKVGDGATVVMWSDRLPATVIVSRRTKSGKLKVAVQEDKATRTDGNGISERQSWSFERNSEGRVFEYSERKDGVLRECRGGGTTLWVGSREKYYDFSF